MILTPAVAGGIRVPGCAVASTPAALKAMVPVSVRDPSDVLGNHISFVFAELPCDDPDPLGPPLPGPRDAMSRCKLTGSPRALTSC